MRIRKKIPLIDQHDKKFMYGGKFGGNFIPETLKRTNFNTLSPSSPLNIEVDTIGKWIEKLLLHEKSNHSLENKLRSMLE